MRRDDLALDLSKVGKRDELKVQPEPHWRRLSVGCYLGFRPSKIGGAGSWIERIYDVSANLNTVFPRARETVTELR